MTITDRTNRAVESVLRRLEREYDAFEVVEKTWTVSGHWYDWTQTRTDAGALGGAGVWILDDEGRVLLVRREDEDRWEEPGGKHEPGESFEETARREAAEEAGIECTVVGVEQAHRITIACEDEDRLDIEQLFVIFQGDLVGGEPRPEHGETEEVRWWDDHPERLHYEEIRHIPIPAAEDGNGVGPTR